MNPNIPPTSAGTHPAVNEDQPWLLDSRAVSALLGIGRTKVFEMMATGALPVVRLGRCVRVPREGLKTWIANSTTGSPPFPNLTRGVAGRGRYRP